MDVTKKSDNKLDYVGNELDLFKNATVWKSYFSSKIKPFIKGDVLEVGAGMGVNTQYLSANNETILSWCLLEPDSDLVARIPEQLTNIKVPQTMVVNGILSDIKDKTFDTIIYIDVLEHIEHSKEEILLAKKHLNPDGHLIILVPAYNFLYNAFDKGIGHFRRYDKSMLLKEINGELSTTRLFYLDSLGFFASLANKYFLKKDMPSKQNVQFWDKTLVPISKFSDSFVFKTFGKSLIGIFKNET